MPKFKEKKDLYDEPQIVYIDDNGNEWTDVQIQDLIDAMFAYQKFKTTLNNYFQT